MWNIGLDESQSGIKISRRNINNLRYANDTILMAENVEKLNSLLMRVKEESEKADLGDGVEKMERSCTIGGNVNWYSHYGRWYGDSLKKLGIKPPYDPAIPLLGIYPKENKIEKDTRIPLFIAALFTIARTWKQLGCPLTDEWIKKL